MNGDKVDSVWVHGGRFVDLPGVRCEESHGHGIA